MRTREQVAALTLSAASLVLAAGCASTAVRETPSAVTMQPLVAAGHIGCPVPNGPVGIAASARAGSAPPEVTPAVAAVLHHAVVDQQSVAIFDTDGSPSKVGELSLTSSAANAPARAEEVRTQESQLSSGIQNSRANAAEADPLTALDEAARSVRAHGQHGTVVLIDSGLQSSGALRYQSAGLLLASGNDVVGFLRSSGELPDLRGFTVVLSGLGDTSAPQERLDIASRGRLVEQWSAIAKAGGAACVYVDSQPLTGAAPAGLPDVTTVPVPKPAMPKLDETQPVALREDSVAFKDNSAQLRNVSVARQDLKAIARQIARGHYRVSLVGTTATAGTESGRLALSLQRAKSVKRLLCTLGVPADHISTRGAGTHYPAHIKDLDSHGNLIPQAAVRNRAVFLTVKQ